MGQAREAWTVIESPRLASSRLPAWARIADAAAVALIVIGFTVSATGGFRLRFGEWRFALTSLARPALLAFLVAGVRHYFVREPAIDAHLVEHARQWSRSAAWRTAMSVWIGSRPALLAAGLLAVLTIGYPPGAPPWRDYDSELFNLPLRWDAGWYLQIAENGYQYSPEAGADAQQNIVFFPAYPMATRAIALLLGNQKSAYVAAAMLVSLTAFLGALAYLYAFARDEIGEERAPVALWLLASYPFAIFYGAIYTESLYLLAALGAFHHVRRREFVRAGLWGLLIGLTRPNGALLAVPLALFSITPWLPPVVAGGRIARPRVSGFAGFAAVAFPLVGALLYSIFIWGMTGNPIAWATGHAAWGRRYTSLPNLIATRVSVIGHAGLYEYVARSPYDLLNVLGALFVIVAIWPVWRRFGIAFAAFIAINILPPLTTGGFLSAGRFSSVLFPAFVWLAAVIPPRQRTAWIVSFAVLQALCAMLFYTWRPLF